MTKKQVGDQDRKLPLASNAVFNSSCPESIGESRKKTATAVGILIR